LSEISLWRAAEPLLLASTSATRRALLASAALEADTEAPGVDERSVEDSARAAGASPAALAQELARAKALAVSHRHPGRLVLGADQTLELEGQVFHKPAHREDARRQISALSGRRHALHSAFALARGGAIVDESIDTAYLTVRDLSPEAVDLYLRLAGDRVLQSVGGYQVEGLGIHLFERIEGDHSTILGLPLRPLLVCLRKLDLLAF